MAPRIKLVGTADFVRTVRQLGDAMLQGLAPAVHETAGQTLAASMPDVPFETGELMASGFVSGPVINRAKQSVSATAGFDHPFAGPIHEGVHGSITKTPPHFLRKAVKASRASFKKRLAEAAKSVLARAKR